MPEIATPAPAAPASDPKSTAQNIVNGIHDKAAGKGGPAQNGSQPPAPDPIAADPNTGKEKYVVDGKEIWLTPERAREYAQKGIAFEPKMDQLTRLQRETSEFLNTLKNDPARILLDKRLGHTPDSVFEKIMASGEISDTLKEKVGQWYYKNVVEPMKLSPEEKKAREDARWREERERQDASARDQQMKLDNQRRVEVAMQQVKAQISEAMAESGLPDNNSPLGVRMAQMVADEMRLAYRNKVALTPKAAIENVKKHMQQLHISYIKNRAAVDPKDKEYISKIQPLIDILGEDVVSAIQNYLLKRAKAGENPIPQAPRGKPAARNGERKTINEDDFRDYLADLKKQG